MKWRNSKERELLSSGGGNRDTTIPSKENPHPDLTDAPESDDLDSNEHAHLDSHFQNHTSGHMSQQRQQQQPEVNNLNDKNSGENSFALHRRELGQMSQMGLIYDHVSMDDHEVEYDEENFSDSEDEEISVS